VARPKLIPRKLTPKPQPATALRGSRITPDLPDFDRVIHERLRLGILSALAINNSLSFNDLKRLLVTTDGTLSVHARKLEDARYILSHKRFEGRVPRTEYTISALGRTSLENYLVEMEDFIRWNRGLQNPKPPRR
jgi:DNA-binding transcriptional ArsR family regulator